MTTTKLFLQNIHFNPQPIFHLYHTKLFSQNHPQNLLETIIFSDILNHFFLPATKVPLQISSSKDLVQRNFGDSHHHGDHPKKTRQFYELFFTGTESADITHTADVATPSCILYSKCIISNVLGFQQWKDPLQERQFPVPFEPPTYNYLDYKMAWLRAFFSQTRDSFLVL